jgi:hypothetical protein
MMAGRDEFVTLSDLIGAPLVLRWVSRSRVLHDPDDIAAIGAPDSGGGSCPGSCTVARSGFQRTKITDEEGARSSVVTGS